MRILIVLFIALQFTFAQDDYTEKMNKEHQNDKPIAAPIAQNATTDVTTKDIVYAKIGDKEITGYLAHPKDKKDNMPGIIVIQEWWGLNDNIKSMTRKLAGEGYVALAVDMYGEVATTRDGAFKLMKAAMADQESALQNLQQAHKYLQENCGVKKIGSIGWCFGGHWSLRCGLLFEEKIDAVVIYYGRLLTEPQKLSKLSAPVLGIFGELDRGIPVKKVKAFESALNSLKKENTIHIYPEANHAFANPSGTRYNEKAAQDAWTKTLEFFQQQLNQN